MIPRRQFLKMSLTACGCAACGGLGISAFTHSAWADSAAAIKGAGYDLWFIGGQRDTIVNGKLAAALVFEDYCQPTAYLWQRTD